jgi:hypothetical protein
MLPSPFWLPLATAIIGFTGFSVSRLKNILIPLLALDSAVDFCAALGCKTRKYHENFQVFTFVPLRYPFVCDVMLCHQVIGTQRPETTIMFQNTGHQSTSHVVVTHSRRTETTNMRGTRASKKSRQSSMDVTKQCSNEKIKIWANHSQHMD